MSIYPSSDTSVAKLIASNIDNQSNSEGIVINPINAILLAQYSRNTKFIEYVESLGST